MALMNTDAFQFRILTAQVSIKEVHSSIVT